MKYWKIRRKEDGMYSAGGSWGWSRLGKTYHRWQDLLSHLGWRSSDYVDCELVEFETIEVSTRPMIEVLDEKETRDRERAEEDTRKSELREMARLEELKAKYGR